MKIPRIYDSLDKFMEPGKVLVLYGPRRVGKTTLLQNYLEKSVFSYRFETGEDVRVQAVLSSQNLDLIKSFAAGKQLVVLDEAQYVANIGFGLKLLVDHLPDIRVVATGSASFDLANKVGEPLVGRKWTKILYPVSQLELNRQTAEFDLRRNLENFLVYGSYPEVLTAETNEKRQAILSEIAHAYLLKDILTIEQVKSSQILVSLLKLLAFQIGGEVSLSELGTQLGIDKKTVKRYLDLLEKTFIIIAVPPCSRNLRKAIAKKKKYFFLDNGIRNALINNFNRLDTRNDVGQLWENFLVSERLKKQAYQPILTTNYFWRTYDQKEIDWVEEREGKLFGYEFKWRSGKSKNAQSWLEAYPETAEFKLINQDNYSAFIS